MVDLYPRSNYPELKIFTIDNNLIYIKQTLNISNTHHPYDNTLHITPNLIDNISIYKW
jgi:hypothetical protein